MMRRSKTALWVAAGLCGSLLASTLRADSLAVRAEQVATNGVVLNWNSLGADFAYTVQIRDAFAGATPFANAPGAVWPMPAISWTDTAAAPHSQRFYRLVATPMAPVTRGRLVTSSELPSYSAVDLTLYLMLYGIQVSQPSGVDLYKLIYETIDPQGRPTIGSGVVAVPQIRLKALPLLSYQHGTLLKRSDAPSASRTSEALVGVAFAASGYVASMPDFLGLGDSPGFHPYHHARSEATATIDLLRATREFCASKAIALNDQLFLCGYSQGGHATMATHQMLQERHAGEFTVTASAPMAGAYDMSGVTAEDFLSGRAMPNPYYFVYLLASYCKLYASAPLSDLLIEPYATQLPPLLDGNHSSSEVNAVMPRAPMEILQPAYRQALRNDPLHPLRLALRDNDLFLWVPQAPMQMYHCSGDEDVLPANSQVALAAFHAAGATQVRLLDALPGAPHGEGAAPSLLAGKVWFDTLKR